MSRLRLVFLLILLILVSMTLIAAESTWRLAPLNPEFTHFIQTRSSQRLDLGGIDPRLSHPLPSPLDLSHLAPTDTLTDFPGKFDLRELDRMPVIQDQDGYPACQAFATMGMLESMLLPQEILDLSEWHIYRYHGFDYHNEYGDYTGGNWQMNAAYLLRWSGPVDEKDSPYGSGDDPGALNLPLLKHIQEMRFFPARRDGLDNQAVKRYLMEHGAFYASIFFESGSYNSATASHYYSGGPNANHGVVVVGWDDDYDRFRFLDIPPQNGAFILRNSWGGQWGHRGYFYMSYFDAGFTPRIGVPQLGEVDNFTRLYQYDPLGAISMLGGVSRHAWGCNVFEAEEPGELSAVGFYLLDVNSAFTIRVYRHVQGQDPAGGRLFLEQEGERTHAGFVTVPLDITVPLAEGERFAVAVHFHTPNTSYPIPVEYAINGYSSAATASPGQSFISHDGLKWYDLTAIVPHANACIKAYTAFRSLLEASLSVRVRFAEGWIFSYPYVSVTGNVDPAGLEVASAYLYCRVNGRQIVKVDEIPVSSLSGNGFEWLDTQVAAGNHYAYQVRCFGPDGRFLGRSDWVEVEVGQ